MEMNETKNTKQKVDQIVPPSQDEKLMVLIELKIEARNIDVVTIPTLFLIFRLYRFRITMLSIAT